MVSTCKRNAPEQIVDNTNKPRETVKETSRRVRPERVNKWPNCVLADDDDDTARPDKPQMKIWRCALHTGYLRLQTHTHNMQYFFAFSTATMVSGTRLNVTSFLHCWSCLNMLSKILTPVPLPRGLRRRSAAARLL